MSEEEKRVEKRKNKRKSEGCTVYTIYTVQYTIIMEGKMASLVVSLHGLPPFFHILLYLPGLSYCFLLFSFNTQPPL
jgi:hypothetical protein